MTTTVEPTAGVDPWPNIPSSPPPPAEPDSEDDGKASGQSSEEHFEARVESLLGELLSAADLDNITDLEPLIADVLFKGTIARVIGASGTFKSFLTLDIAGCIGTGTPWHGRAVQQGLVIYLVAEGIKGVRKRVRGWEQHHGRKMTGVLFLPRPVQAMDPEWLVLMEAVRRLKPALIICDTQARITVGVEENSATEMGRVVDRMEKLRAVCDSCILLVHHTGTEGERGRGSTAVKGALQTEIGVTRKGSGLASTVTVSTGKQKDDEELGNVTFGLKLVKLDGEAKEDGSPVTTVVLVPVEETAYGTVDGSEPPELNSIPDIVAKLDRAKVPNDAGRPQLQSHCVTLGIKASTTRLAEVARIRKARPAELSPELSYSPVIQLFPNCPDGRTAAAESAGQSCSEQSEDSNGSAEPGLSCPPSLLKEGDRQDSRPPCTDCGNPMKADWAARGYDHCLICDTTEETP